MKPQTVDASLLSFVAAFVDTCGFVGLYGLFTAHVTGNFVLLGAELVSRRGDLLAKLLSFPVFIAAVALTLFAVTALRSRGRARLAPLLLVEGALLLVAAAWPLLLGTPTQGGDAAAIAVGMTLVAAMGLQNALMRLELANLPPTTVMTGNVTQSTIDVIQRWRTEPDDEAHAAANTRLHGMAPPMLAFLVGAAGGAAGYALAGMGCLLAPAAACLGLAWRFSRRAGPQPGPDSRH